MPCELIAREFEKSDGSTVHVSVRQLPATKALELYVELIGKVGTEVFPLIDNNYDFGSLIRFMAATNNEVISELMKRVVCQANIDGAEVRPALFDMVYNGELMLVCKVFAFVCEANYQGFFRQGLEMNEQKRLEAAAQSKLEEQKNSSPAKI